MRCVQIQSQQAASERNKQGQQELERAKAALERCQRRLDRAEKALLESRRTTVQLQVGHQCPSPIAVCRPDHVDMRALCGGWLALLILTGTLSG